MVELRGSGAGLLERLSPLRKIAVLRASRVGDFICGTPALRALRAAAPQAEISLITLPMFEELTARLPYVDRFIAFPGYPGIAEQFFDARRALAFFARMHAEQFDLAIQLQGSGVYSNPFTLMLGAKASTGFIRSDDAPGRLDAAAVWPDRGHEIERTLGLMRHLGAPSANEAPEFPLLATDRAAATALLAPFPSPVIGVHAGSHDPHRRWPPTRFVAVARALLQRYGGTVLLFGSQEEAPLVQTMVEAIGPNARSLAGHTPLITLGAIIERLTLLVTNDTGPAHIAYALGTPTVSIYRTGGTHRYGPLLSGPFRALEPNADDSDELVAVADVLAAAESLLDSSRIEGEMDTCLPYSSRIQSAR